MCSHRWRLWLLLVMTGLSILAIAVPSPPEPVKRALQISRPFKSSSKSREPSSDESFEHLLKISCTTCMKVCQQQGVGSLLLSLDTAPAIAELGINNRPARARLLLPAVHPPSQGPDQVRDRESLRPRTPARSSRCPDRRMGLPRRLRAGKPEARAGRGGSGQGGEVDSDGVACFDRFGGRLRCEHGRLGWYLWEVALLVGARGGEGHITS